MGTNGAAYLEDGTLVGGWEDCTRSEVLLARALNVIPNGTQTFSKSRTLLPAKAPFYAAKADGAHIWDVDGNMYIDFVSALTPIILGYNDPDVNRAVHEQVDKGVLYSLPHELEIEVSEQIVDMVPCAEMVRFGKNGSDATSGAVRLARAYTGRDHIACCGYHGWQDWSNAVTGRNAGVPQAVKDLTHVFQYNDIDSLYKLFLDRPGQYACVIMEPMNKEWPQDDFLHHVKELAHANGALFIMDEVITGFRLAIGGAQEYFNIVPDLATFGKAIANGYPLSALAGRADIMRKLEDVHYSFTNGGELVSLAAAQATLKKLKDKNVPEHLTHVGETYLQNIGTGHPVWKHLNVKNLKAFISEMLRHGSLCFGSINLSYAHSQEDMFALQNALAYWEDIPCEETGFKIR